VSVYLIDGYNLMHELLGHPVAQASGTACAPRGGGASGPARALGAAQAPRGPARADKGRDPASIPNLEDERERLIDRVASYMGGTSDRAIVVFDSRTQALQKSESATTNVEVYFGSFFQSADAIIEREVYALHAGENVVVVSSDYGLQKVIFRPNVVRCSSRQFAGDLQAHTRMIANRQNCITMGNKVEDRIVRGTLDKLKALRQELEKAPAEKPPE